MPNNNNQNDADEIIERSRKLLAESEALIEQAERRYDETSELFRKHGIERGMAKAYLESNRVPPAEKQKAQEELTEWNRETEEEISQAQSAARDSHPHSTPPRRRSIRV